jgi:hypothetical protein
MKPPEQDKAFFAACAGSRVTKMRKDLLAAPRGVVFLKRRSHHGSRKLSTMALWCMMD